MKEKLKSILLIDDDEPTNFLNRRIIKQLDCSEETVTFLNGQDALEFLKTKDEDKTPLPELMFLDINMPGMNGWEFLKEYGELKKNQDGKHIIVMLTNSMNPDDRKNARNIGEIDDFMNKPLRLERLDTLIRKHFPEVF